MGSNEELLTEAAVGCCIPAGGSPPCPAAAAAAAPTPRPTASAPARNWAVSFALLHHNICSFPILAQHLQIPIRKLA